MLANIFPLKIHVWGGLGSQLYAVHLHYLLSAQLPNRKIILVLHSSGVTKRNSEINLIFPELETIQIDDFVVIENEGNTLTSFGFNSTFKKILKNISVYLGILSSCENSHQIAKLKPWVMHIRGHYSYNILDSSFISLLESRLEQNVTKFNFNSNKAVHLRLGDLIALSNKNPISTKRIISCLSALQLKGSLISIISDSPNEAKSRLSKFERVFMFDYPSLPAVQFLASISQANLFIGTNSKISLWAGYLIARRKAWSNVYFPYELQNNVRANFPNYKISNFYR